MSRPKSRPVRLRVAERDMTRYASNPVPLRIPPLRGSVRVAEAIADTGVTAVSVTPSEYWVWEANPRLPRSGILNGVPTSIIRRRPHLWFSSMY